ncbi:MAG: hypothetical protein C5S38_03430 [Candidatus Methanophagaceae archaeon]|nr:MAG: hypothetical protein C5S38_03430 [Methanophagales archaeon]
MRPDAEYKYDAIYRLIEACGREHIGQASIPHTTWNDMGRVNLAHPNDGQAMRNYFEFYEYDEVGNNLRFIHRSRGGDWIRTYEYDEQSLIELDKKSNRLSRTVVHPNANHPISEPYTYDPHGNMTSMPHLPEMAWDFKDQLHMVDKGGGCMAYYVYDAGGQRVRKVIEQNGMRQKERFYIGGFEVYRKYNGGESDVTLERETLHVMDDKQRIAMVETKTIDGGVEVARPEAVIRFQLNNHLGFSSLELDENARVISYEECYPYGSTSYQAVSGVVEVSAKRYRYTGMERDDETGLNYHGARYYAPWLGRWTSCDLLHLYVNRYLAMGANPITIIDRNGLFNEASRDLVEVSSCIHDEECNRGYQRGTSVGVVISAVVVAAAVAAAAAPSVIVGAINLCRANPQACVTSLTTAGSAVAGAVDPNPAGSFDIPITPGDEVGRALRRGGEGLLEAAARSGAVEATARSGGEAVEATARSGGEAVEATARSGGEAVEATARSGGEAVEATARSGGEAVEAAARPPPSQPPSSPPSQPHSSPPQPPRMRINPVRLLFSGLSLQDLMQGSRFRPTQHSIYHETVEELATSMRQSGFSRDPLHQIIVDSQNTIVYGHHRIIAARLARVPIPEEAIRRLPEVSPRPHRPWSAVSIRPGRHGD